MKKQISVDASVMTAEEYSKDPVNKYQELIEHYNLDGLQEMVWRAALRAYVMAHAVGMWTQNRKINRCVLAGGDWEYWLSPTIKTSLTGDDFLLSQDVTDEMLVSAIRNRMKVLVTWINGIDAPAFMIPRADNPEHAWIEVDNYWKLYQLYLQKSLRTIEDYIIKGPSEDGFVGHVDTDPYKHIFVPPIYLEHFGADEWDIYCCHPFLSAHEDGPTGATSSGSLDYYERMMVDGLKKSIDRPLLTPECFPGA